MILAAQDNATLQRLMLVKGWNIINKNIMNIDHLGTILKELRTKTMAVQNDPYPEIMLTVPASPKHRKNNPITKMEIKSLMRKK